MIITFHILVYIAFAIKEMISSYASDSENRLPNESGPNNESNNPNRNGNNTEERITGGTIPTGQRSGVSLDPISSRRPNNVETPQIDDYFEEDNEANDEEDPEIYKLLLYKKYEPLICEPQCFIREGKGIQFAPPLYYQRYKAVEDILKEPCWKSSITKVLGIKQCQFNVQIYCPINSLYYHVECKMLECKF